MNIEIRVQLRIELEWEKAEPAVGSRHFLLNVSMLEMNVGESRSCVKREEQMGNYDPVYKDVAEMEQVELKEEEEEEEEGGGILHRSMLELLKDAG